VRTDQAKNRLNPWIYAWLLLAIFFEYARPASFVPGLHALPLNSLIPVGLFLVCIFARGMRPMQEIWADPMPKWILIYLLLIPISGLGADTITYSFNVFNRVLGYVFLWFTIVRIVTTFAQMRGVFLTLIVAHVFLIIMNPKVVLDPSERHYVSGATFLGDGNDFSLSLCILIPFAIELALRAKSKLLAVLYWCLLAVVVLGIIGTSSRGATLGMATVFGYLWLRSDKKMAGLVGVAVVLIGVLLYAPQMYFERMGTLKDYENESSAASRIVAWRAGTKMMLANPIMGVGAGNFPNNFPKFRPPDGPRKWMTAHSMYFLVIGELGIPGIIVLLFLVFGNVLAINRVGKAVMYKATADPPDPQLRQTAQCLYLLTASGLGFAVAGAFLSVSYYPHIFILNALYLAARAMALREAGIDMNTAVGRAKAGYPKHRIRNSTDRKLATRR